MNQLINHMINQLIHVDNVTCIPWWGNCNYWPIFKAM